jgi:transcriptional regulator with XRE-family HTH domain
VDEIRKKGAQRWKDIEKIATSSALRRYAGPMSATYRTREEIAARIVELRNERGMSQRELASAIALEPSAMNRIEKSARGLSTGELVRLAAALAVDVDAILCDEKPVCALRADCSEEDVRRTLHFFDEIIADYFAAAALVR